MTFFLGSWGGWWWRPAFEPGLAWHQQKKIHLPSNPAYCASTVDYAARCQKRGNTHTNTEASVVIWYHSRINGGFLLINIHCFIFRLQQSFSPSLSWGPSVGLHSSPIWWCGGLTRWVFIFLYFCSLCIQSQSSVARLFECVTKEPNP